MSDSNKDVTFSVKAVINKQKTKVLFAEIDNCFADVLFSFFTLPLGKIVRLLESHYGDEDLVFGSLATLYHSLSKLDESHFCGDGCKEMLLNPASLCSDLCRNLKLDIGDTLSTKFFSCEDWKCAYPRYSNLGMYHGTVRCACGKLLNREVPVRQASPAVGEVFTKTLANFVISDNLEILPNSTLTVSKIVGDLGLVDLDEIELRNVTFGFNEIMDLLKGALFSETPLTDIILQKQPVYESVLFHFEKGETPSYIVDKSISVKAIFQKSTCKLLFVEAGVDFVDFLCSLLTISLGGVCRFLGPNTCLKNVDNLYKGISLTSPINDYLKVSEVTELMCCSVPHGHLSRNCILPVFVKEEAPKLQYYQTHYTANEYLSPMSPSLCYTSVKSPIKSPLCEEKYVKGQSKFMVKDDLTVTPLLMASYISSFIEQKISLSDVDEMVLEVGVQEALSILKASLISDCALSLGLDHLLKNKLRQGQ